MNFGSSLVKNAPHYCKTLIIGETLVWGIDVRGCMGTLYSAQILFKLKTTLNIGYQFI